MNMKNTENKNIALTVFTPTYNRAYCLHKCYESLKRQTSKEFQWLIIDDGSTDNTYELVQEWINEECVLIEYIYQENQGMHGAHNTAYKNCNTELNVCIDSDDYMTDNAVEKINEYWRKYGDNRYSGIISLDITKSGSIIGSRLPDSKRAITLSSFYAKGGTGDKKLTYRTEVMRKYPDYPIFVGEKYVGLNYKYLLADQDYTMLVMNEPICVVEYMEDGSSMNMVKQYMNNPKGFAFYRKTTMLYAPNFKRKFIECVHYVSSTIISKNKHFLSESPCKLTTFLAVPFGVILYLYIRNVNNSKVFKGNQ